MRWFVVTSLVLFMVACGEAPAEAEKTDEARPVKLLTVTENNGAKLREFPWCCGSRKSGAADVSGCR